MRPWFNVRAFSKGRLLALALAVEATIILAAYIGPRIALSWTQNQASVNLRSEHTFRQFPVPGIVRPHFIDAASCDLSPHDEVLGIDLRGKSRAYSLKALKDRTRHVVNDLFDGQPVSVTYCNLTDCVQAYTRLDRSEPLDLSLAGLFDGEMVLKFEEKSFLQKSGLRFSGQAEAASIELTHVPIFRMTWKEWKARHPETLVYCPQ